jgi:PAS domain S-box-containing protein
MKKTSDHPEPGSLRVLILEDNPADAELIKRQLRRAGIIFVSRLVESKASFSKALAEFQPQVILSDFKLPTFDGLGALKIARQQAPDTPFLFVSGSIGEEKAIETLALGASDYIFKDNLARLGPAVKRVGEEARLRLEKKITDEKLLHHVEELRLLSEAADRFVHINDLDKIYEYLSKVIYDISGADYLMLSLYDEKLLAVRPKILTGLEPFQATLRRRYRIDPWKMVLYFKDMRPQDFSDFVSRRLLPVRDGLYGLSNRKLPRPLSRDVEKLMDIDSMHTMGFSWENQLFGGVTVFFKKGNGLKNASQVEALVNLAAVAIKRLAAERSLRESEQKYRTLVTQSPDGIFIVDLQGNFLSANQAMCTGMNYSEAELLSMKIWDIVPERYMDLHKERLGDILKGKAKNEAAEYMVRGKDGESHYVAILSAPYFKDNKLIGFQGIARDITEKKKMEIRLRESEEYYRTLVETSPDAIIIVDAGGRVTFASPKTFDLFGVPAQTAIEGIPILDFVEPGVAAMVQARMVEILSGRSLPEIREYRLLRHDHRPFWGEISSSPLRDAAGRNVGLLLVCRDVSERKRTEDQLRYQASLLENVSDAILATDRQFNIQYWNAAAEKQYGWKAATVLGNHFLKFIQPQYISDSRKTVMEKIVKNGFWSGELMHNHQDGTIFPVQSTISEVKNAEGRISGYISICRDISERKRADDRIHASLKEKEVLLQEIHHRVKNNLQIISGLLTLQADQSAGKTLEEVFHESQDRIHTIALIHEKLYRSHNLAEIAFDDYLRALTENLFSSHGIAAGRITARYDMEKILLTIEKAIPLGLIVNELISNSLKHAFPGGRRGEVRISLHGYQDAKSFALKTDSGTLHIVPTCELVVADDGIGLPAAYAPAKQKTLGMNLVSMLANQLQAELKVRTGPGSEFRLLFSGLPAGADAGDKHQPGGA